MRQDGLAGSRLCPHAESFSLGDRDAPQPNLVAGMKWLPGTYTSRFNRRHKLFGHLFPERYKSLIVDGSVSPEPIALTCLRIHRRRRLGQTGLLPSAPLDLRNPDAGRRGRHPVHPATLGTRRVEHDANLHTGQHPRVKTGPLHHPSGPDWEKRVAFQDRERRVSYSV